ncbi:MAG TPA: ATP synthase F1 subunit delta [Ignavibacteria bacterium]|nr:ATP synthase F1 subunit delta [Ignavibacteria bacterium]
MVNRKAARRYTTALYGLAEELKLVDNVKKDFEDVKKSIAGSRELDMFIKSPVVNPEKKLSILQEIFKGKVSDLTLKFIMLLSEKNRINMLGDIANSMLKHINDKRGIISANITTAVDISENVKKAITDKLKKYTGKEISSKYTVDKNIKGGFIAQVEDKIIDASILRQLELLKEKFILGSFNN